MRNDKAPTMRDLDVRLAREQARQAAAAAREQLRARVLYLHRQGYTAAAIARTLKERPRLVAQLIQEG